VGKWVQNSGYPNYPKYNLEDQKIISGQGIWKKKSNNSKHSLK